MKELIKDYLLYLAKELNYSNETIKSYKSDLIQYDKYNKDKKINFLKITKEEVRNYLKYLDNLKLSNKSIARKVTSLRMFYNFLVEIKEIDDNIFNTVSNPKIGKKLPNYLNYEEIENLLNKLDVTTVYGYRNRLILELVYSTGIRLSELSKIKVNDINLSDKTLKVMGKGSKERIVYFGRITFNYLEKYLSNQRKILLNNKPNDYLFINKFGNRLSKSGFEKIIKSCAKEVSLKHNISMHTLRHTFATHLLNNGADIKTVQELLGHESLATTEIYTHVTSERIKEVYLKTHPREK